MNNKEILEQFDELYTANLWQEQSHPPAYISCGSEVKSFISKALDKQREEIIEEIEERFEKQFETMVRDGVKHGLYLMDLRGIKDTLKELK